MRYVMITRATICLTILLIAACGTTGKTPAADARLSFDQRVALYSEESLMTSPAATSSGTVLVGTRTCPDHTRERLDQLVPISDARAQASISQNAPFGLPDEDPQNDHELYLYQDEYIERYSTSLRLPVFATYRLRAEDVVKGERAECFREDPRIADRGDRSRLIDYDGDLTGFDRGHLVPDADMQRTPDVAMNTYFMTNMMPQHGSVNSGSWKYLEDATRLWAVELGEVLVVSGPIFDLDQDFARDADEAAERAPPTGKVAVPTAFFKIIVDMSDHEDLHAISFILPHTRQSTAPNPRYVLTKFASIDEIERVSGFDLFPELDDPIEDALEAQKESDLWCRKQCN